MEDEAVFAKALRPKNRGRLGHRIAQLSWQVEACDRGRSEAADLAENVFELSQALPRSGLTRIAARGGACSKSSV